MKAGYALKRIRLVNFHNFVDETISVNGHLFLIGGNGSGKTTVLDAVHFVLTAGKYEMELNSAARMATQSKHLGRKLQGIFLRYDIESGQKNPDKTIGYAALEFENLSGGNVLCIGCGALAISMDTIPHIWGFEAAKSLDQLELLRETPDGQFPLNQEELKTSGVKVYNRDRYVDVIAQKFFNSKSSYRETMRLIAAGKSYRELVTKFKDQSQLFRDLLPPPDEDIYKKIQQSLVDIEKIQQGLEDQKERIDTLRHLEEKRQETVRVHEKSLRYAYLDADYNLQQSRQRHGAFVNELKKSEQQLIELRASLKQMALERQRIESQLEIEQNSYVYKNSLVIQSLRSKLGHIEKAVERIDSHIKRIEQEVAEIDAQVSTHWVEIEDYWQNMQALCSELSLTLNVELSCNPESQNLVHDHQALIDLITPLENDARNQYVAINHSIKQQQSQQLELEKSIAALRREKEAAPPAKHFQELEKILQQQNIEFAPFYRTIEPADELDDNLGRVIEEIIGARRLCAIVVGGSGLKRAKAAVLAEPYNIPVIDSIGLKVPPVRPDGLRKFLRFHGEFAAEAECFAAEVLDKYTYIASDRLFEKTAVKTAVSQSGIVLDGCSSRRVESGRNQYLGTKAREQTRREQIEQLEAQINELGIDIELDQKKLFAVSQQLDAITSGLNRMRNLSAKTVVDGQQAIFRLNQRQTEQQKELKEQRHQLEKAGLENEAVREKLKHCERTASAEDIDRVEQRINELKNSKDAINSKIADAERNTGVFESRIDRLKYDIGLAETSEQKNLLSLSQATDVLLAHIEDLEESATHQYVYVTCRGNQVKSGNASILLEESKIEFARKIGEVKSFILHNPLLQRDYRLSFDEKNLAISHNDESSLDKLRREIENRHIEDEKILEGKNRKLFEDLILNQVVHSLCTEESNLKRTIKAMNSHLADLRFGSTRYSFSMHLRSGFTEFRNLIQKVSATDEQSRNRLRDFFDGNRQLLIREGEHLPEFLDYRQWYDVILEARSGDGKGVQLSRRQLSLGSGGEQSVPNYILLLSLAKVHLDHTGSKIRILLMDEAFYGIDAQRRDELLNFADQLGLNLVIAHPELDGVTDALSKSTTLLVDKTVHGDVYLGSYDLCVKAPRGLFDEPDSPEPAVISLS